MQQTAGGSLHGFGKVRLGCRERQREKEESSEVCLCPHPSLSGIEIALTRIVKYSSNSLDIFPSTSQTKAILYGPTKYFSCKLCAVFSSIKSSEINLTYSISIIYTRV